MCEAQNGEEVLDKLDKPSTIDDVSCISRDTEDIETSGTCKSNHSMEDKDGNANMNSCQKLLEFAQNFLPVNTTPEKTTSVSVKQEVSANHPLFVSQDVHVNDSQSATNSSEGSPIAVTSQQSRQSSYAFVSQERSEIHLVKQENEPTRLSRSRPAAKSPTTMPESSGTPDEVNDAPDRPSLNAAQKLLVEAMMNQQKQFYEQCTNNWMSVQRSDNNCMSKSKAERYRWCVQGGENQPKLSKSSSSSTQSHVTSLKKSASMAGSGVTPLQDKLYSTVLNGASKFCCRDCGNSFNTLVDLTIHMNKTGHFRDTNVEDQVVLEEKKSSETPRSKKRCMIEDDSQSEKVLTCMGCGHLFESLQDLSVHMIKTKHYENVPSLRMWSQKQGPSNESSSRKRSLPSSTHFGKKPDVSPPTSDPSKLPRTSAYHHPLFGGMNAAAAYASLLSSPWFSSAVPNAMVPSLFASSTGFPYNFGFPSGVFPGLYHNVPIPSSKDPQESPPAVCTQCKETFQSWQKLAEHAQETSHFPSVDAPWLNCLPGFSISNPSSLSSSSQSYLHRAESTDSHAKSTKTTLTTASKTSHEKTSSKAASVNCQDEKPTGSFDFIRSIESTIKAAISKVESSDGDNSKSKLQSMPHDNYGRASFSPFLSSMQSDAFKHKDQTCDSIKSSQCSTRKHKEPSTFDANGSSKLSQSLSITWASAHQPIAAQEKLKTKQCGSRLSEDKRIAFISSATKLGNDVEKTDHPLDLTVKRDIISPAKSKPSSSQCSGSSSTSLCTSAEQGSHSSTPDTWRLSPTSQAHKNNKSASSSDPPSRKSSDAVPLYNSQSVPTKSPLQSLSDNMQTLFSYMKPRIEAAIHQNSSPTSSLASSTSQKSNSEPYKPLMITSHVDSNPLQEMLKIVNKTDAEKPLSANSRNCKSPESHNSRKRYSTGHHLVNCKKSKISRLLQDLVVPKDESLPSNENPLQLIQDLVDNKLHDSHPNASSGHQNPSTIQSSSTTSLSSSRLHPACDQLVTDNTLNAEGLTTAASALLSLRSSLPPNAPTQEKDFNGLCNSHPRVSKPVNSPTLPTQRTPAASQTSLDQLLLEVAFTKSCITSPSPCEPDQALLDRVGWSRDEVQKRFRSFDDELKSRGKLTFLRYHDNDDVELVCSRCGAVFHDVVQYSDHVEKHIEQAGVSQPGEPSPAMISKEETRSSERNPGGEDKFKKKYTIQGAVCFGSYLDHVTTSRENGICQREDDVTSPVANNMMSLQRSRLPHRRCADEVSSSDDVIRVTS